MTVVSVEKDVQRRTLTLVAEFDAPVERVWELWADPRQLERWWGPPGYPSTFERHDLSAGGEVTYFMTGPEGETSRGWWRVTAVDPPTGLEFEDGFAKADGTPIASPITTVQVRLAAHGGRTSMELHFTFESQDHMDRIERMGALEVFPQSVAQMDDVLAS